VPVRRLVLTATGLAAAAILAPGAAAQAPTRDSVIADQVVDCIFLSPCDPTPADTILEANVESGPAGENTTGTVQFAFGVGFARSFIGSRATCLKVTGNAAVIGFTGELRSPILDSPVVGSARVADLGGAASSQDTFDVRFDFTSQPQPGPTDCSFTFGNFGSSGVNDLGDIVVTDAQPFPTSKEQCKNGGWRNFPGFKNQGDCVNFLSTGGRNQPPGS
jgi:hypothetical protein